MGRGFRPSPALPSLGFNAHKKSPGFPGLFLQRSMAIRP